MSVVAKTKAVVTLLVAGATALALASVVNGFNESKHNGTKLANDDVSITFSVVRAKNKGTAKIAYCHDGIVESDIEMISINWHKTVLMRHGAIVWLEVDQETGPVTIDMFIMNKSTVLEHGVHTHLNAMRIYAKSP